MSKDFSNLTLTARSIKASRVCKITRRDGTIYRMTDAQGSITAASQTWSPVAGVVFGQVKHTIGGEMPSMGLDVAHKSGGTFETADINNGFFDGASVELYVVNRDNPTILGLLFVGTIQPVVYSIGGKASFDIRGYASKATGNFVQTFAAMCRTDLFSVLCGLDPDDFDRTATVATIINKFNFTISGISSPAADGVLNQGLVVTDGGFAFEVGNWVQSTNQITAYLPCSHLISVSEGLTLYPGCDKRHATCFGTFNNSVNFQGEAHFKGAAAASTSG